MAKNKTKPLAYFTCIYYLLRERERERAVRGQFAGVTSPLPPFVSLQRLGGRHLFLLSHFIGPKMFSFKRAFLKI